MSSTLQGALALTAALTSGAFAQGSTASQFTNAAAIVYSLLGRLFSRAIVASQPLVIEPNTGLNPTAPNAFVTLAPGQSCAFAIVLDSALAFTVIQGPIVEAGQLCALPAAPGNKALVGAIKVSNLTNPFIPGTTNFNAAGVTTTYFNLATHPGAPL